VRACVRARVLILKSTGNKLRVQVSWLAQTKDKDECTSYDGGYNRRATVFR